MNSTPNPNIFHFADPFPVRANSSPLATQSASSIFYDDKSSTSPTQNSTFASHSLATQFLVGMSGISVEFWIQYPVGGAPMGNIAQGPGFQASTYNRKIELQVSEMKVGTFVVRTDRSFAIPQSDGLYHHVVMTYDLHAFRAYWDGQPIAVQAGSNVDSPQEWWTNATDQMGPDDDANGTRLSQLQVSEYYNAGRAWKFFGLRLSNLALSPSQVMRNFENEKNYSKVIYASSNGTGNGSSSASPTNLATAIGAIVPGTKIILASGDYRASDFQLNSLAGAPQTPIVIQGADGDTQINIKDAGGGASAQISQSSFVTLRHLNFIDSNGNNALTISHSNLVWLDGVRVSGTAEGVSIQNSASLLVDNSIFQVGSNAIHVQNSLNTTLRNNTIYGGNNGFLCDSDSNSFTMLNNLFSQQNSNNVSFQYGGQLEVRADGNVYDPANGAVTVRLPNRTFSRNDTNSRTYASAVSQPVVISGNTCQSIFGLGTYYVDPGTDASGADRYLGDPNSASMECPTQGGLIEHSSFLNETKSLSLAASFVNTAQGDFRLNATVGNPIATGVPFIPWSGTWVPLTDIQGTFRPFASSAIANQDVGAYIAAASPYQSTFSLSSTRTTSAGVYDSTGKLLRTLWSGQATSSGSHSISWNGLDDQGAIATGSTPYHFGVMDYTVQYTWEGLIGNSSANPRIYKSLLAHFASQVGSSMALTGNTLFMTGGCEGSSAVVAIDLAHPNNFTDQFGDVFTPVAWECVTYLATDGTTLYGASTNSVVSWDVNTHAAILATSNNSYGSAIVIPRNGGNPSPGDDLNNSDVVTGLAVQKSGSLLFVSRASENKVFVFNKSSGASVNTISVPSASHLATDANGDLWVAGMSSGSPQLYHYTNLSNSPTLVSTTSGFDTIVNITGSQASGESAALVMDGGQHEQVKKVSSNGSITWSYGQLGGYFTNGPQVTHDKFHFFIKNTSQASDFQHPVSALAMKTDGSFWMVDGGLSRMLNFTMSGNTPQYAAETHWFNYLYQMAVDMNDSTRVFAEFLEFKIDYSKSIDQAWTLVNFWGAKTPGTHDPETYGFLSVANFPDGKTYAMVQKNWVAYLSNSLPQGGSSGGDYVLVRLDTNGLVLASGDDLEGNIFGSNLGIVSGLLQSDLSLLAINYVGVGSQAAGALAQTSFSSFNGSGIANYGSAQTVSAPNLYQDNLNLNPFPAWGSGNQVLGRNGLLISANNNYSPGFHLGALRPGSNDWLWKAAPAWGGYDGYGSYNTYCNYCGSALFHNNGHLLSADRDEFWMGSGESNQIRHYYDNGLFIGQFGRGSYGSVTVGSTAEGAGNMFSGGLIQKDANTYYLYTNAESAGGMPRWRIDIDGPNVQSISIP